ncbi:uncharacterized protein LOC18430075 isoform X2 [Amborella trichopoda]|uniref:uncharacterized protein LOC18430075 isoform X2 n=1 Tax=Amborella trichopoda TaxID=13333 RepID=UPI0009BF5CCD|nr:uncharacterized protein LOC18430075 isoform X2 [Amborella trichopoda]|eukprot:XP_020520511.1 uncharacterized protein LOC18430075 isoform X2 [Amborella trichopoda]
MEEGHSRPWRLRSREYFGEISALCLLNSSFPLLLAGTGPQILLYDVENGELLNSFFVFDGIRVHGISASLLDLDHEKSSSKNPVKIAVYGERKVKVFSLCISGKFHPESDTKACIDLILVHSLPRFNHWVMDICFLKGINEGTGQVLTLGDHDKSNHLVIGLSDNSLCLWHISRSKLLFDLKSPERCLLYAMRIWGDDIPSLHVASGTIYNEILIWKIASQGAEPLTYIEEDCYDGVATLAKNSAFHDQPYAAIHLNRLTGHAGSIFRLAWSSDGLKLISVSDDRSARIWTVKAQKDEFSDPWDVPISDVSVGPILFGHNARVWDCYISESIIITCGEDCTCRVWGIDGNQLLMFEEHVGRGIWRCVYDPTSFLLITAGFDSAIKVHYLNALDLSDNLHPNGIVKDLDSRKEIFSICTENVISKTDHKLMDSNSEYVRCLHFAREDILYVATNQGSLYHVQLSIPGEEKWTEVVKVNVVASIVCLDLLPLNSSNPSKPIEDWVALGDGKGNVTVVQITSGSFPVEVALFFSWQAEQERQLLGVYWCKSLGYSHLFTADPRGRLKLWKLGSTSPGTCDASHSLYGNYFLDHKVLLVSNFASCFGRRIMCLDASIEEEDHTIHVYRLWVPTSETRTYPQVLHLQFHGREIHSLCFIALPLNSSGTVNISWIATGSEDGTVRLTSYSHDSVESWPASKLLGEHVGGSAVRSICLVSDMYTCVEDCTQMSHDKYWELDASSIRMSDNFILISVGAKQVLTCWLLKDLKCDNKEETDGYQTKAGIHGRNVLEASQVSFQWLSTHMPPKFSSTSRRVDSIKKNHGHLRASSSGSEFCEDSENDAKAKPLESNENDWRYLAVTSFFVKTAECRSTACFIVAACSDVSLTLRVLVLPSRLWFDVALLVPETAPILALQHVVIPLRLAHKDKVHIRNVYIVIGGSTDGRITFWDLTETIESFMRQVLAFQPEKYIDCNRRPRTGRGSQGGRWWKSITNLSSNAMDLEVSRISLERDKIKHPTNQTEKKTATKSTNPVNSSMGSPQNTTTGSHSVIGAEMVDNSSIQVPQIQALYVLPSAHQSGVNCLCISTTNLKTNCKDADFTAVYFVASGGDDQALQCLSFDLVFSPEDHDTGPMTTECLGRSGVMDSLSTSSVTYRLRLLHQETLASAHSSAVKGIWTDGIWVFTTGLDQRVRCWHRRHSGKLVEHFNLVVNVPEPETLDAWRIARDRYQIAVAGRGMQMVEFFCPTSHEHYTD